MEGGGADQVGLRGVWRGAGQFTFGSGHIVDLFILVQESLRNCSRCNCIAWCSRCIAGGPGGHEDWCHLLKTALEDYKHEKSLGHQVQKYAPTIQDKYKALPPSTEALFEKEVAKLVSNKLPGKHSSDKKQVF